MSLRKKAFFYISLTFSSLFLVSALYEKYFYQPGLGPRSLLIPILVFGLGSIGIILWLTERLLLSRLERLNEQVSHIGADGDVDEQIKIEGQDELAELGQAINQTFNTLRKTQIALRENEESYRRLVEQSTVINYTDAIDDSSSAIYISPQVKTMLGYSIEEWIADRDIWVKLLHPEDRDRVLAENKRTNATGEPFCIEYRMLARDGHVVWVHDEAVVIRDADGRPLHWQGVMQDITERKRAENAERRQRELAEALYETGTVLNSSLDLETLLDRLLEEISGVIPYDSGCVMLIKEGTARIVRMRGYEKYTNSSEIIETENFDVNNVPAFRQMIATHQPMIVADTRAYPEWVTYETGKHVLSWAGAPLVSRGQVIGFLSLDKTTAEFYQPDHARSLEIFATQAALALQNAHLLETAQRHARENQTLREAAAAINSALELEQVLESILTQLERVISYDSATIFLVDGERLQVNASKGFPNPYAVPGITFSLDDELIREADCNKAPVIIQDAQTDSRYRAWRDTRYTRGWLGVPLYARGEMIGFMTLNSRKSHTYEEAQANLAWAFAHQAAIAIDNARLFKKVHQLANTDSLTGVYNRRHFFDLATKEFERANRFSRPLSLIIWDIDHFKTVNDTFGHIVGDQVLKMVAERCRSSLRELDLLGRYGGEEFIAILTEADSLSAREVGERLRAAIESTSYVIDGKEVSISISVGIADIKDCLSLDMLLDHADQALFHAKRSGRNRVWVWGKTGRLERRLVQIP